MLDTKLRDQKCLASCTEKQNAVLRSAAIAASVQAPAGDRVRPDQAETVASRIELARERYELLAIELQPVLHCTLQRLAKAAAAAYQRAQRIELVRVRLCSTKPQSCGASQRIRHNAPARDTRIRQIKFSSMTQAEALRRIHHLRVKRGCET